MTKTGQEGEIQIAFGNVHRLKAAENRLHVIVGPGEGDWVSSCQKNDDRLGLPGDMMVTELDGIVGSMSADEIIAALEAAVGSRSVKIESYIREQSQLPPRTIKK